MGQSAVLACSDIDELQKSTPEGDLPDATGSILDNKPPVVSPRAISKSVKKPRSNWPNSQKPRAQSTKIGSAKESAVTVLNEKNPFRIEENKALFEAFERRTNRTKSWVENNRIEKVPAKKPEQNPFDRMTNKILHRAYERRTKRVEDLVAGYNPPTKVTNPFRTTEKSSRPIKRANRSNHAEAGRSKILVYSDDEDDTNPFTVSQNPNSPNYQALPTIRNPNNPRSQDHVPNRSDPKLRNESVDIVEFLYKEEPEESDFTEESNHCDRTITSSKNEAKNSPLSTEKVNRFDNLLQSPNESNQFSVKNNLAESSSSGDSLFKKGGDDIFGKDVFNTRKKSRDVMDIFDVEEDNSGDKDIFKVDNQQKSDDKHGLLGSVIDRDYPTRKSRSIFEEVESGNTEASKAVPNDSGSNRSTSPFDGYDAKESSNSVFHEPEKMFSRKPEDGDVYIDVEKTSRNVSNGVGRSNRGSHSANSKLFGEKAKQKSPKSTALFTEEESNNTFISSRDMDSESEELLFAKKEAKQPTVSHKDGDSQKDVANWLFSDF